jgi:hypothetical protein
LGGEIIKHVIYVARISSENSRILHAGVLPLGLRTVPMERMLSLNLNGRTIPKCLAAELSCVPPLYFS